MERKKNLKKEEDAKSEGATGKEKGEEEERGLKIIGLTKHGWKNTHGTKSEIDCQTNLNGSVFQ